MDLREKCSERFYSEVDPKDISGRAERGQKVVSFFHKQVFKMKQSLAICFVKQEAIKEI